MTTVAVLLAQKQRLVERLQKSSSPQECDEIERLIEKINTALDFLDKAGSEQ
jgi:hypothetical protein